MLRTAEAVSLGHPDKIADYISSYLLDCLIKQDENVRFAVEVLIKDNTVVLGGEIAGKVTLPPLKETVQQALAEIGYTQEYFRKWGENAIHPDKINLINLIGTQSSEIGQGVEQDGWGDQGVFVGYACRGEGFIAKEQFLAQKLNNALYEKALKSDNLGLDIKTQITLDDNHIKTAIVAVPMLKNEDLTDFIVETLGEKPQQIIVNGTGAYKRHSSIADCGITGRKLACDFYSTASAIGGGSPWTKDASKADLTLNLYARYLALDILKRESEEYDECFVYLSSCIGQKDLPSAQIKLMKNGQEEYRMLAVTEKPAVIKKFFGLDQPVYARLCRKGLLSLRIREDVMPCTII